MVNFARNKQLAEYDRLIDVNIKAVAEAVRTAVKYVPAGGRIINNRLGGRQTDRRAMSGRLRGNKGSIGAYSRGLSWELAPRNITVNTVEPAAIDTDMLPSDPAIRGLYINAIPLKRFGKPEEIAAIVDFLAGPEAGYITGSDFAVDGGINA